MSVQKVRMKKCLLHLACGNSQDGVVSILCFTQFLFYFFLFVDYKLYKFVLFLAIM
jgi:hypothetical protein